TTPGSFKASDPENVYALFIREALNQKAGDAAAPACIKNTGEALQTALAFARQGGLPVLGTGSFYLAAELRQMLA
ncbi:MAG: tetrahydrofolate synthase, partial [Treponema sp.]|nr:tetrahydrofolate synthase [Treponema sp.]